MAKYQKNAILQGSWVKGSEVKSGTKCKLVAETNPRQSQFLDKNGNPKVQDVSKVLFQGETEPKNINLNRATIDALVEAYGEDSKEWMGYTLTAQTEKVVVAGKRVTAVYLVPEGYEMKEDEQGYMHIVKIGADDMPVIILDDLADLNPL